MAASGSERIDAAAHREERRGTRRRLRIHRDSVRRIALASAVYVAGFALVVVLTRGVPSAPADVAETLVPAVIAFAFLFETMDSAAGMGFGTALAPLLFALGYGPLEVDFRLLPSVFLGGFVASVGAPYLVRIVPRGFWRYLIPAYAVGIAVLMLVQIAAG